jgi:N-acetylmuramoyl-L-alanine amidase
VIADGIDTLAELVAGTAGAAALEAEAQCLATAVYYEARSESLAGQLAVAHVVLQRARSGRFPSSLCGVVTQPGQFSFVRAGRLPAMPTNAGQWKTAKAIARIAQDGSWENPVEGALYFHAARVAPSWGKDRMTRIGGHVFYR